MPPYTGNTFLESLTAGASLVTKKNPHADRFFTSSRSWQEEFNALRALLLQSELDEQLKWGKPCYTLGDSNVVIMQGFKGFCALLFTKGALLQDPDRILEKPGENTQSARRIPFTSAQQIDGMKGSLGRYIADAIEVEKSGKKVAFRKTEDFPVPEEFQHKLDAMPELKAAFAALTPGRQRGYLLHFGGARQSETRTSRVEKCIQDILDGKGLNDR
nr:YdeI/OmpD-associated family protein [Microbulbifer zhoushanensis]